MARSVFVGREKLLRGADCRSRNCSRRVVRSLRFVDGEDPVAALFGVPLRMVVSGVVAFGAESLRKFRKSRPGRSLFSRLLKRTTGAVDPVCPLCGGRVVLPKVSVGATHTIMMAATLARGETVIENAAMEPEITNVAECLVAMGARIDGIGTRTLTIEGVDSLHGATVEVVADRIETGTFAMAAAMTGGDVLLRGARPEHLQAALDVLVQAGASVSSEAGGIRVARNGNGLQPVDVEIDPFPGFPTDLQAQFMALMTTASGASMITETIFGWPGLGSWMADAVLSGDQATTLGFVIFTSILFLSINLVVDVIYGYLDRRVVLQRS